MMKKRKLLTYLSILIIMMMVPIGAKADVTVYVLANSSPYIHAWQGGDLTTWGDDDSQKMDEQVTVDGVRLWKKRFTTSEPTINLLIHKTSSDKTNKTSDLTSVSDGDCFWYSGGTSGGKIQSISLTTTTVVHGQLTSSSWVDHEMTTNSKGFRYVDATNSGEFGFKIDSAWKVSGDSNNQLDKIYKISSSGSNQTIPDFSSSYSKVRIVLGYDGSDYFYQMQGISSTPTANITFSPTSTTFSTSTLNVTLTSSNSRDIYYTLDGSTPTTSSSHVTSGTAVTVTGTTTLTAGVLNSAGTALEGISSQTYTYNGGTVSTGYYLVGDLNSFGRRYNDTEWSTKSWKDYGAINKVLKFKDNGDGTYSLRIPAAHPAENDSEWRKVSKEKENVSYQFVIAPDNAFSGSEHTGDLYTIGDDSHWRRAWGLALDWEQVLRPQDTTTMDNNTPSGNMGASGSNNWIVKMNGGSYTITINPTNGTWSVTNDNTTHVMYFITKQDGKWRASYLTDVAESDTYDNDYGNKSGELSEFPNYSGSTVYVAHNWYEHGDQKNFSTKQHLSILGSHSSNGDLAPVTWINAKSGATAKSIFPTPGRYSTHIDPTRGNTNDLNSPTLLSQKIITSSNYPSIGDFTGNKGNAALIDPDATLSPETTTWDNYTLNDSKALTVTMNSHATGYKYSFGASSIPSTSGTGTAFGNLSYDGINVKLGDDIVASNTNTLTIRIQGTDGTNDGTIHSYTYTFNAASVALDFSPKSGFYINSATINVVGGTLPYTYQVKDGSGNVLSTGTIAESSFRISTPGYLTVEDSNNGSVVGTDPFDFTYSTSENYENYYSNGTTSTIIQTGGGQGALNVFIQVDESIETLWLYAYNKTLDTELKKVSGWTQDNVDRQVRLTDAFPGNNMKNAPTINIDGIKYVHLTIPENNLRENDQVAIIVSQGTTGYQNWYTQTTDEGILISRSSDPAFVYVVKNKVGDDFTESQAAHSKGTNYLIEMNEEGNRTIFVTVPEGWNDGTLYCDGWKNNGSDQENLDWQSSAEWLQLYDAATRTYIYQVPNGIDNFYIATMDANKNQTKRTVAVSYSGGRKQYTIQTSQTDSEYNMTETSDGVPPADLTEFNTFLNTPPTTTVVAQNYPNGPDYWKAAPGDLTIKLDPTWGGKTLTEEESVMDWTGNGSPKLIHTENMPLSQTITGLNAGKKYTVQALVRGMGENDKTVTLTLDGATTVTKTLNLRNGSGGSEDDSDLSRQGNEVSMTGRIEYIEPLNTSDTNKYSGTNAGGWAKVEATVNPTQAGWLTISLTGDEWFNLSSVTLLEDANTDHGFRTTASTSATDVNTYDYRDRTWKKNNAFSFFDRGKNRNAVVFADKHTVIAMDKSLLASDVPNRTVERRHPFNVVATNGATDTEGICPILYLTDMGYGSDANNPVDYVIGNSNWGVAYNSTGYRKSGYSFCPNIAFSTQKVVLDRHFGDETKRQTTIVLPFALTQAELKNFFGNDVTVWTYSSFDADNKRINFTQVTGELSANTPYILLGANGDINSRLDGKELSGAKTVNVSSTTTIGSISENAGFRGTYAFQTITRGDANCTNYGYNPSSGQFLIASASGAALKPFRAYFTLPIPYDNATSARSFAVYFDDTVTGISSLEQVDTVPANVYNVNGMLMNKEGNLNSLGKGVYIVNGKKYVVK